MSYAVLPFLKLEEETRSQEMYVVFSTWKRQKSGLEFPGRNMACQYFDFSEVCVQSITYRTIKEIVFFKP